MLRVFSSKYGANINWFPGHMAKTTRDLVEVVNNADVVIEVRDARVPFSSANPVLDNICSMATRKGGRSKPRLVVFNKADLALDSLRPRVATHLAEISKLPCVFTSADRGHSTAAVLRAVDALAEANGISSRQFKASGTLMVVVGIPNVGKSSLINALRTVTKCKLGSNASVAPIPGHTRHVSALRVRESPPLYLYDSSGVMLPRIDCFETGMKLSLTTAIRESLVPSVVKVEYLLYHFATIGYTGFKDALYLSRVYTEAEIDECLEELALRMHMYKKGGALDIEAAARFVLRQFHDGKLGRHTFDFIPQSSTDDPEIQRILDLTNRIKSVVDTEEKQKKTIQTSEYVSPFGQVKIKGLAGSYQHESHSQKRVKYLMSAAVQATKQ